MDSQEVLRKMRAALNEILTQVTDRLAEADALLVRSESEPSTEIGILTLGAKIEELEVKVSTIIKEALAFFEKHHVEGDEVFLPLVGMKASWPWGAESSSIDVGKVASALITEGRIADLLSIISISEKSLKSIDGGAVMVARFKTIGKPKSSTPAFKKLSESDLKQLKS